MKPEKWKGHIYRTTTQFTGTFVKVKCPCYIPYAADEKPCYMPTAKLHHSSVFVVVVFLRCIKMSTGIQAVP